MTFTLSTEHQANGQNHTLVDFNFVQIFYGDVHHLEKHTKQFHSVVQQLDHELKSNSDHKILTADEYIQHGLAPRGSPKCLLCIFEQVASIMHHDL